MLLCLLQVLSVFEESFSIHVKHGCLGAVILTACFRWLYQTIETQLNHDDDMIGGPGYCVGSYLDVMVLLAMPPNPVTQPWYSNLPGWVLTVFQ